MKQTQFLSVLFLLGALGPATASAQSTAASTESTLRRPALMLRDIRHVAMLGAATTGKRLVTVGERGVIAISDDNGAAWRQIPSPVSVTLTAVRFVGPLGWAIGHRGVVLHSADSGNTWTRQLDGEKIAAQMTQWAAALERLPGESGQARRNHVAAARQIASDGADKPLFDLYFQDARTGFIVGAYGLALATTDGGNSWHAILDRFDNPKGLHLYAIGGNANALYIAGEQGMLLRSRNQGQSFERLPGPYRGSFFTLHAAASGALAVAGLNGNAYHSADMGTSWTKVQLATQASLTAFLVRRDGSLLLGDQIGHLFDSRDGGRSFRPLESRAGFPLSGMIQASDGSLTGVGLMGIAPIAAALTEQK